jgi:hypothetical protein
MPNIQPEGRCLRGTPAVDHVPLRYVVRAWITHRLTFGSACCGVVCLGELFPPIRERATDDDGPHSRTAASNHH